LNNDFYIVEQNKNFLAIIKKIKLPKETELLNKEISHLKITDEKFSSFIENDMLENANRNFIKEIRYFH
jgi:hypothetical protein